MIQVKGKTTLCIPTPVSALTEGLSQVGVFIQSPVVTQPPFPTIGSANDINNVQRKLTQGREGWLCA